MQEALRASKLSADVLAERLESLRFRITLPWDNRGSVSAGT